MKQQTKGESVNSEPRLGLSKSWQLFVRFNCPSSGGLGQNDRCGPSVQFPDAGTPPRNCPEHSETLQSKRAPIKYAFGEQAALVLQIVYARAQRSRSFKRRSMLQIAKHIRACQRTQSSKSDPAPSPGHDIEKKAEIVASALVHL